MMRPVLQRVWFRAARAASTHVTTTADGITYLVSTQDDGPGRALVVFGVTPELEILPRALSILRAHGETPEHGILVDVGANIGTTALPALLQHGFERAVAIEPEPENVRVLHANAALNCVQDRLDIVAAAASDEAGTVAFGRGKQTRRGWRAGAGSILAADREDAIEVSLVRIDDELESRRIEPASVGLLWLDVQGQEGHVLAGARSVVEAGRPVVFALRPGKLRKAGGLDPLLELVSEHYTYVADLRAEEDDVRPVSMLSELVASASTTDVLAFGSRRGP